MTRKLIFLIFFVLLFNQEYSFAQRFVKTSENSNVYQYLGKEASSASIQVIIAEIPIKGLFISAQKDRDKISVMAFDPIELSNSNTIFIKFDPKENKYTKLITQNGEFPIRGALNFSFEGINQLSISIDTQQKYCAIHYRSDDKTSQTLLSIFANRVAGSINDPKIIKVLLGNTDIGTYKITKNGEITISGRPILPGKILGVLLEGAVNACRKNKLKFISIDDYKKIQGISDPVQAKKNLNSALKKVSPLLNAIILSEDKDKLTAFNVETATIINLRVEGKNQLFCVVEETAL